MKQIGYHVDRYSVLQPGKTIELYREDCPCLYKDQIETLLKMFPDGFSQQGVNLFYSAKFCFDKHPVMYINDRIIETVFEYVRATRYSHMPSRLQSFFISSDIDTAKRWKIFFGSGNILEVEYECPSVQLDSSWFSGGIDANGVLDMSRIFLNAENYWSGVQSPSPCPEVLVRPPVKIIRLV